MSKYSDKDLSGPHLPMTSSSDLAKALAAISELEGALLAALPFVEDDSGYKRGYVNGVRKQCMDALAIANDYTKGL